MKKLLALAIVVICAGAVQTRAAVGMGDLSFDGSLEVSGNSANNEADLSNNSSDGRGVTATRVRLGMNAEVTEGVKGRLELTRTPGSAGSASLYGGAAKPTSVATEEAVWQFNNANVSLEDLWGLNVVLGRQYVGNAGDLVWHIGTKSDDALSINSIDGLLLQSRKYEMVSVDLFTGKAAESAATVGQTNAASSGDVNLTNIQVDINKVLPGGTIGLGYMMGDDANTNASGDNDSLKIARLGVKGGAMEDMITYRGEYLLNSGEKKTVGAADLKYKGSAIDLGAGLNLKNTLGGNWGFNLNYVMGSGDKTANNDDKSFHDFSLMGVKTSDRYFGEIFGKSNALNPVAGGSPLGNGLDSGVTQNAGITVLNLGAKFVPANMDKYSAKLDYYLLNTTEKVTVGSDSKDDLGSELDLALGYNHSANVGLEAGYAMLMPGKALSMSKGLPTTQDDTVTKLYARATIKWGGESK